MILPIVAYGSPILRKVASDITPEHPGLEKLIEEKIEDPEKATRQELTRFDREFLRSALALASDKFIQCVFR